MENLHDWLALFSGGDLAISTVLAIIIYFQYRRASQLEAKLDTLQARYDDCLRGVREENQALIASVKAWPAEGKPIYPSGIIAPRDGVVGRKGPEDPVDLFNLPWHSENTAAIEADDEDSDNAHV